MSIKREKINFTIIFLLLTVTFSIIVTKSYTNRLFFNLLIVTVLNVIVVSVFELWHKTKIKLNKNEKTVLSFIAFLFYKNNFSEKDIYKFVLPYFKVYPKEQIKNIIAETKEIENAKFFFYWGGAFYKNYILFIITDILYENNIRQTFMNMI